MKTRYEGLLILNVKGNEESAKEIVEKLEGEFKKEGAEVEQVQKIGNRHFTQQDESAPTGDPSAAKKKGPRENSGGVPLSLHLGIG